jgi:hypothetical protein
MSMKLEIKAVDRHQANWDAKTLFTGFKIRAILRHTEDAISNINNLYALRKRLAREVGTEGEDWILQSNGVTNEGELYLQNSGKLVMWKLQDHDKFMKLFDRIEQHKDNLDEVREDAG